MSPRVDTLPGLDIEGLGLGPLRLEDLADRDALSEMASSFEQLFSIPIRIVSKSGALLTDQGRQQAICAAVNQQQSGASACGTVVAEVKELAAQSDRPEIHACFTGAIYRIVPIEYDRRVIGKIILGPYLPASVERPPASLFARAEHIERAQAAELLPLLPRAAPDRVDALCEHLRSVMDLVLFSGHKAWLTSKMHLASMTESYRDLTEKTARLEEAYERLKELDRLKSNFLATVSHELRTPLTSIMGYSEMLSEGIGGSLNDEQLEFVQTIRTKSDQLLGLIMSLLDLSKLESGTSIIRRGDVDVADVIAEAVSTLAPVASKKGVVLDTDVPADLPRVLGDADRLRQVFINLSENAIKFTPTGGRVLLGASSVSEQPAQEAGLVLVAPLRRLVEVRVVDTGIGIPESHRTKVFDPFYQVDQSSTREYGGTGLGLAIVKRLVEAHHGSIRIESNTPRGAVFVVSLPIARTSIPPAMPSSSPPPASMPPIFQ